MAWLKTNWANLIGTDAAKLNLTPTAIGSGDINCSGTPSFNKVSIKVVVIFGTSPTNNVEVAVYGLDKKSANEPDTRPIWKQVIDQFPSSERRITIANLDVSALDSIRVTVKNNDSLRNVSVWASYCAGYIA